jgi:DNA/RNA-binding domain of Phe-tRNA-synthetase-like protein
MSKLVIEPPFWALFPQAEIGVVLASGIDNTVSGTADAIPAMRALLAQSQVEARQYLTDPVWSNNAVIAVWRQAYRRFNAKKGARSSIEALLKRVDTGRGVAPINPLVDLYNAVSLRWGLPCGGEDLDAIQGDLRLTVSNGQEAFVAIGDDKKRSYSARGNLLRR